MNDPARKLAFEDFQQEAMDEAHHQMVWRDYCEARAYAERSDDIAAGKHAQAMYMRFMRLGLTETERRCIELENEVVRLKSENAQLRGMLSRKRIPLPNMGNSGGERP